MAPFPDLCLLVLFYDMFYQYRYLSVNLALGNNFILTAPFFDHCLLLLYKGSLMRVRQPKLRNMTHTSLP